MCACACNHIENQTIIFTFLKNEAEYLGIYRNIYICMYHFMYLFFCSILIIDNFFFIIGFCIRMNVNYDLFVLYFFSHLLHVFFLLWFVFLVFYTFALFAAHTDYFNMSNFPSQRKKKNNNSPGTLNVSITSVQFNLLFSCSRELPNKGTVLTISILIFYFIVCILSIWLEWIALNIVFFFLWFFLFLFGIYWIVL